MGWRRRLLQAGVCVSTQAWRGRRILAAGVDGNKKGGVRDADDVDGELGDCGRVGRVTAIAGSESGLSEGGCVSEDARETL